MPSVEKRRFYGKSLKPVRNTQRCLHSLGMSLLPNGGQGREVYSVIKKKVGKAYDFSFLIFKRSSYVESNGK